MNIRYGLLFLFCIYKGCQIYRVLVLCLIYHKNKSNVHKAKFPTLAIVIEAEKQ